jgi:hypothetical protein
VLRTLLLCCLLAGAVVVPVGAEDQTILPLASDTAQDVRPVGGDSGQDVRALDGADQRIDTPEPPTPAGKVASAAGKVVLGVTAAVVSLGFMVASLLFF